ncbi:sugar-binding protein [Pontibacillus salicampi]|uniref:Sugar-binding protein n=1 Tax=Pontibacillus salicampi TaxID=1449801 RepID=A0ABV6LM22_9BACI
MDILQSDRLLYSILIAVIIMVGGAALFYYMKALQHPAEIQQADAGEKQDLHFVLIPQETENDYWRLIEEGARQAEQELGVAVEYNGPKKTSITEHIEWIEKGIASKVDGIITQGLQESAFTPVLNKAVRMGIPVVTIDTDAPSSERAAYVGTDNYEAGFMAGKALIEDTGGTANVGIITGSFEARNMKLRVQGFRDAVQEESGVAIMDIKSSEITRIQAAEKTEQLLNEYPEIDAFFGTSALDGFGIASTVQQRARTNSTYIITFDSLPETVKLIREGVIDATVAQQPYEMGYESVHLMKDLAEGRTVDAVQHTTVHIVRRKDLPVSESLLLPKGGTR